MATTTSHDEPMLAQLADELLAGPIQRWTARRKAAVAAAVRLRRISVEEACQRYELSENELARWLNQLSREGIGGLKAASQHRRPGRINPPTEAPASDTRGARPAAGSTVPIRTAKVKNDAAETVSAGLRTADVRQKRDLPERQPREAEVL
jgi:transposase-like protein